MTRLPYILIPIIVMSLLLAWVLVFGGGDPNYWEWALGGASE